MAPPLPWPRLNTVRRWAGPTFAVLVLVGTGLMAKTILPDLSTPNDNPVAGVYRVVEDSTAPTAHLVDDRRWQQVAFGSGARTRPRCRSGTPTATCVGAA